MSFSVRKLNDKPQGISIWMTRITAILAIARPVVGLYSEWKVRHDEAKKRRKRIHILKRTLIILVAVLAALVLLAGIGKAMISISGVGLSKVVEVAGTPLQKDVYGYTNILLMGQGNEEHDGKYLTDTIMIASIDPDDTGSTVLLSIPRDLYLLNTERMGDGRINSMYRDYRGYLEAQGKTEDEAAEEALREVLAELGRKIDMDIHYAIKVDFDAFVRAVDTLGGIDIEVPYDIEDLEYPDTNFGFDPFIIRAGMRHLDGETALKYARSRHTTSDFGRSARQQQLLAAMAEKAKEAGVLTDPSAITSFMKIMSENVETTMTLREIMSAAELAKKLNREHIISMQLNDRNGLYGTVAEAGGLLYTPPRDLFGGASVLLPVSIPEFPVTWKQIQTLRDLLFRNRETYLQNPEIAVLNAGAPSGSAGKLAQELKRYGFYVSVMANAKTAQNLETSRILLPPTPETDSAIDFFTRLLEMERGSTPADLPEEQKKRITIILGEDYRYTPLQDLVHNVQKEVIPSSNT